MPCLMRGAWYNGDTNRDLSHHTSVPIFLPVTSRQFSSLMLPITPPCSAFEDATLPLHLDLGSARGRFILSLAEAHQVTWCCIQKLYTDSS
jgi:hypothetical protein